MIFVMMVSETIALGKGQDPITNVIRSVMRAYPQFSYVVAVIIGMFDQKLEYVGFAKEWERIEVDGSIEALDFIARQIRRAALPADPSVTACREGTPA